LAGGFIVVATFVMSAQDAIVKLASADLSLWQIFTIRSMIAIVLLTSATTVQNAANSHCVGGNALAMISAAGFIVIYLTNKESRK
jgi:hypothetical protein